MENLDLAGLVVEKGPLLSRQQIALVRKRIRADLEAMAETEHNGWVAERVMAGWRYADIPEKDAIRKLHPLLLPYEKLPEAEKAKDRRPIIGYRPTSAAKKGEESKAVPGYIERLNQVGFRIVLAKPSGRTGAK